MADYHLLQHGFSMQLSLQASVCSDAGHETSHEMCNSCCLCSRLIQRLTCTTDLRPCGLWTKLRCRPVNAFPEHQWVVTLVAPRSDPACSALCSASLRGGPLPVVPGGKRTACRSKFLPRSVPVIGVGLSQYGLHCLRIHRPHRNSSRT